MILKFFIFIAMLVVFAGCGKPESLETLAGKAMSAAKNGNWSECISKCDKILEKTPNSTQILTLKSIALNATGKSTEAATTARKAAELDSQNFPAHYMQGYLTLAERGRERKAIDELTRALQLNPGDANTLLLLSTAAGRVNDENTELYLFMLSPEYTRGTAVQSQLGVFYALRGDTKQAAIAFNTAHASAKNNPTVLLNLARFLDYYANNAQEACSRYQEYLALTTNAHGVTGTRTLVEGRINALKR